MAWVVAHKLGVYICKNVLVAINNVSLTAHGSLILHPVNDQAYGADVPLWRVVIHIESIA
jgi:hypothetical protein